MFATGSRDKRGQQFRRAASVLLFILLPTAGIGFPDQDLEKPQDLSIALDKPSLELDAATEAVEKTLNGKKLSTNGVHSFVTGDKHCVLYGDLFNTGDIYALLEVSRSEPNQPEPDSRIGCTAFARLQRGKWKVAGLWDIESVWRSKGWKPRYNGNDLAADWLPFDHPAERAFYLKYLDFRSTPEVIVAGDVGKYFQDFYILRFDLKSKLLILSDQVSMAMPERKGEYVGIYYQSPRRAIWEEWDFCKWEGLKLVEKASWHEETPYNNIDPPFQKVAGTDDHGNLHTYHIEAQNSSDDSLADT